MEIISLALLMSVIFAVNGNDDVLGVSAAASTVSVRPGEQAKLSCNAGQEDIIVCAFTNPSGTQHIFIEGLSFDGVERDNDVPCGLVINSVTDNDAGNWKCSITARKEDGKGVSGSDDISVVVLKAPSSVSLNVDGILTVTPEQTDATVRCTAEGGEPVPSFSWLLDGAPASVQVVDSGEQDNGHFQEVSMTPTKADNGKTLECVANSEAYKPEDLENGLNKAGVQLNVEYTPEPQKDDLKFYGMSVGKPTEIEIKFRLNPAPSNMEWVMADGTRVPQGSESNDGKYRATLATSEDADEPDLHTAMLTINDVSEKDGGTTSSLVVTNAHGEATISFQIEIGAKPPTGEDVLSEGPEALDDEAGTGPVIAIIIIILLVIVVIAVAVVARSQGLLCFAVPVKGGESDEKEKTVDKEEGSDTESAEETVVAEGMAAKDQADTETDAGAAPAATPNPAGKPRASLNAQMTSLLTAFKKALPSPRKSAGSPESEEVKLKDSEEKDLEKNKDDIVYADLDKTALSDGNTTVTVEDEKTEYAEIKPSNL